MDIDLADLFDSKLCCQNVTDGFIYYDSQFPDFSKDQTYVSKKLKEERMALRYDQSLYENYFKAFFEQDKASGLREKHKKLAKGQSLTRQEQEEMRKSELYPI